MTTRRENMKAIEDEIARLRSQREAISNRIEGLESALRLMSGGAADLRVPQQEKQRRGSVKTTVLDIVTSAAEAGVTVVQCVESANSKYGIILDRASVSSLMSRLKKDDILFYDGDRYRLKQYAGPRHAA